MQNRNVPSFFFTNTTFEAHGLAAGSTIPCFRIFSTFLSIHLRCWKKWRRSGWRIGRLSPVSIWYSTKSVRPISWSLTKIILRYFTDKLYAFCRLTFVRFGGSLSIIFFNTSVSGVSYHLPSCFQLCLSLWSSQQYALLRASFLAVSFDSLS